MGADGSDEPARALASGYRRGGGKPAGAATSCPGTAVARSWRDELSEAHDYLDGLLGGYVMSAEEITDSARSRALHSARIRGRFRDEAACPSPPSQPRSGQDAARGSEAAPTSMAVDPGWPQPCDVMWSITRSSSSVGEKSMYSTSSSASGA